MTPTQTQSPCKQLIQPLFGGKFLIQQPTPGRQANLGLRLYNRPSAVASPHRPPSSYCPNVAIHRHRGKTAEERFNMLARGWLAYPVTPMHAHLPPKSGCINVIPRFALSRRRATALFRNPVRKAQRSVPGFSSTPTSACRRYATSPPSAVASPIIRHPSVCARGALLLVTPSARSDSGGRMGHRLAPSICASEMRSCADRASGHAFS